MTVSSLNLALAAPEIFLLVMTLIVMLVDLFSAAEKREGRLFFPAKGTEGRIRRKLYLDESLGTPVTDVWTDISRRNCFWRVDNGRRA